MKKLVMLCALASMVLSSAAQEHARKDKDVTSKVHELNPVVVTGNGHHEYLKSSTTPVHVLTAQEIQKQGVSTFQDALTRLMPNVSFMPNAMGSYIRLNGLGNKYILILINGKKVIGDVSGNVDIDRINMGQVKRIEVLNGAASSLYGSDAIGGVINIITEQPKNELVSVQADSRISAKGKQTYSAGLNFYYKGLGSYTNFKHDEADSYRMNDLEYVDGTGESPETQKTRSTQFLGYHTNAISQRLTYEPIKKLSLYGEVGYTYKMTDRDRKLDGYSGGYDYELRTKSLRFGAGAMYKFTPRNSLQLDFTSDNWRYGSEYKVDVLNSKTGEVTTPKGYYSITKKQQLYDLELKNINRFTANSNTIFGADWRNDFLLATSGNVDNHAYMLSVYGQHDMQLIKDLRATLGVRYDKHETFGNSFTPKVALMYAPGDFNIRLSYAKGFRAPGLDELFYHYFKASMGGKPVVTFGNKDLNPEKSDYISLSAAWTTSRFSFTATGFLNFVDDMIIKENIEIGEAEKEMLMREFPDDITEASFKKMTTFGQYINSDKGKIKGINLSASYNVTDGLNLTANYAYTYGRTRSAGVWQEVERCIRNAATVAANYNHSWGRLYTLNVNVNGRFQSRTPFPSYEDAPGFGIMNLNTTHTFNLRHLLVEPSLGIDNLFDKVDKRIDTSKRRYALITPGRMLVVGLRLRLR